MLQWSFADCPFMKISSFISKNLRFELENNSDHWPVPNLAKFHENIKIILIQATHVYQLKIPQLAKNCGG